jgi:hypothetical protein
MWEVLGAPDAAATVKHDVFLYIYSRRINLLSIIPDSTLY